MALNNDYVENFIKESREILNSIDLNKIEEAAELLNIVRGRSGRIFFCGSGGGAGHSSHAACDFRKIAAIESYCVSDNISELTARVNDEGWSTSYSHYLECSRLNKNDCIFVFSVGGGSEQDNLSMNLVYAMKFAEEVGAKIIGIVGRDGGYLASVADVCILIPPVNPKNITAQVEGIQALLWHLLVNHPKVQMHSPKWESIK